MPDNKASDQTATVVQEESLSERGPNPVHQSAAPRLLPGMAMIAVYLLFVAMVGGFGALTGRYPSGRYVILAVCTLMVVGVFGFLRLRRWGWALVTAGCLLMSMWTVYISRVTHAYSILIMAGLNLCFFLYLVRTEVRDRVR